MKIRSAKAKGRTLQQSVANKLIEAAKGVLSSEDVKSTAMGVTGEDIQLSPVARMLYPFNIECKNVEKLNIWEAVEQAEGHGNHKPMVAFKKNNKDIYVALKLEDFLHYFVNPAFDWDLARLLAEKTRSSNPGKDSL